MGGVNAVNASWRSGTAALSGSAGPGGSYQVWGSAWDTGMTLTVHTTPFCTKDLTKFRAVPAARARRPLTRAPGRFTASPGAPDIYCLRSARSDEQLGLAMARQHLRDLGAISIRRPLTLTLTLTLTHLNPSSEPDPVRRSSRRDGGCPRAVRAPTVGIKRARYAIPSTVAPA